MSNLTQRGRAEFATMAAEHERWLAEMFSSYAETHKRLLYEQLGRLRVHLAQRQPEPAEASKELATRRKARCPRSRELHCEPVDAARQPVRSGG